MGWGVKRVLPKEDGVVDVNGMHFSIKFAAAKAFPSVVGILSRRLPYNMACYTRGIQVRKLSKRDIKERGGELVLWGSGIIYDCHPEEDDYDNDDYYDDDDDGDYIDDDDDDDDKTLKYFNSIIICPATLFVRSDHLKLSDIPVDVCLWDGKLCEGRVIACDFHYNLAAVLINTPCQLPTATLRNLDDFVPLNLTPVQLEEQQQRPPVGPNCNKFNISPETHLINLSRSLSPLNAHTVSSGVLSTLTCDKELDYDELYWVKDKKHPEDKGGAVINYLGEVIGLMFYDSSFLPINLVSIWWKNFKSCRKYHRPCIGMKIANLHATCTNYSRKFLAVFPDVTGGVVVTEVAKDSLAYSSGIRCKDIIVECDGNSVHSSLELFEMVWNKVGIEYVELKVFRERVGKYLNLSLKVEQTSPDKMYQWEKTFWNIIKPEDMAKRLM